MLPTALTNRFVGAADNTSRLYKCMICSHALVGAAGQTAPTNHLEPPLQKVYVVVVGFILFGLDFNFDLILKTSVGFHRARLT